MQAFHDQGLGGVVASWIGTGPNQPVTADQISKVLGPEHPDTLGTMNNVAHSYFAAGRWDEALKLREEVLVLRRKVLGPDHPHTLWTMNSLVESYRVNGDVAKAEALEKEIAAANAKAKPPGKQP